jgi:hypothetical protein
MFLIKVKMDTMQQTTNFQLSSRIDVTQAVRTNRTATPNRARVVVTTGALGVVTKQEVAPTRMVIGAGAICCDGVSSYRF